jgi:hypothetical protein
VSTKECATPRKRWLIDGCLRSTNSEEQQQGRYIMQLMSYCSHETNSTGMGFFVAIGTVGNRRASDETYNTDNPTWPRVALINLGLAVLQAREWTCLGDWVGQQHSKGG